jgi:hypothetical protein
MTTPTPVSTAMKALWFKDRITNIRGAGQDKGAIIAVRHIKYKNTREWLIGSPPEWYGPTVASDQKKAWSDKIKRKVDLTVVQQTLDMGNDAQRFPLYLHGGAKKDKRFEVEQGNSLVDPFPTLPANVAGAGAGGGGGGGGGATAAATGGQTKGAGAGGEEDEEEEVQGEENDDDEDEEEDLMDPEQNMISPEHSEDEDKEEGGEDKSSKALAETLRKIKREMEEFEKEYAAEECQATKNS